MTKLSPRASILCHGVEDWVGLPYVVGFERDALPKATEVELRDAAISLIGEMLREGLIRIGELSPRFVPWGVTADEATAILESQWTIGPPALDPAWAWWLDLTLSGRAIGEKLYAALPDPEEPDQR